MQRRVCRFLTAQLCLWIPQKFAGNQLEYSCITLSQKKSVKYILPRTYALQKFCSLCILCIRYVEDSIHVLALREQIVCHVKIVCHKNLPVVHCLIKIILYFGYIFNAYKAFITQSIGVYFNVICTMQIIASKLVYKRVII